MKIMCVGDLHISDRKPENRIDDYVESQFKKMEWILDLAHKERCECVLQPGDFFDSAWVSHSLIRRYIELCLKYFLDDSFVYCIAGQHDQRYHNSNLDNTPLGILDAACAVWLIKRPRYISNDNTTVAIYGAGWETEIPEPENKDAFNILVCHKMIIEDKKLWSEQKTFSMAQPFLIRSGFDLIVSGDNHHAFQVSNRGKTKHLINCGSMMRSRSDQGDHRPRVYIVDVENNKLTKHYIPVEPFSIVVREDVQKEKERNLELESFVENLSGETEIEGLDFKLNMIEYLKTNPIEDPVKEIIEKNMRTE